MSEVKNFSTFANPADMKWNMFRGSKTGGFCKHFKPPTSCKECHIDQIATIKGCMDLDSKFSSMGLNGGWGGNVNTQTITRTMSGTFGVKPSATCLTLCSSCGQTLPQSS